MNTIIRRRGTAVIASLVIVIAAYACYEDSSSSHPVEPLTSTQNVHATAPALAIEKSGSATTSTQSGTSSKSERVAQARARMAWVGEIHNMAMRDLTANRLAWVGNDKRDSERVCRGIANLLAKYSPAIKSHASVFTSAAEDRKMIRQVIIKARSDCSAALPMSLFAALGTAAVPVQEEVQPWVPFANEMLYRLQATDATVAAVNAVTAEIMSSAGSLSTYDLEVLAAVASTADASAVQWNSYGESGGFDGKLDEEPMLMFARAQWWRSKTALLVYSDVFGAVIGGLMGGPVAAGWSGIGASGLYLISIM